jgi:hypothetical protein
MTSHTVIQNWRSKESVATTSVVVYFKITVFFSCACDIYNLLNTSYLKTHINVLNLSEIL